MLLLFLNRRVLASIVLAAVLVAVFAFVVVSNTIRPVVSFDELSVAENSYVVEEMSAALGGLPLFGGRISAKGYADMVKDVSAGLSKLGMIYSGYAFGEAVKALYAFVVPFSIVALAVMLLFILSESEPARILQLLFMCGDRCYARFLLEAAGVAAVSLAASMWPAARLIPMDWAGRLLSTAVLALMSYGFSLLLVLMWIGAKFSQAAVGVGGLLLALLYGYVARLHVAEPLFLLMVGVREPGWVTGLVSMVLMDTGYALLVYKAAVEVEKP